MLIGQHPYGREANLTCDALILRPSSIRGDQCPKSSQIMIKMGIGMPNSQSSAYRILLTFVDGSAQGHV
jgi:hypothetical protein